MYKLTKKMEVAGSHCLDLSYESKCRNCHGHNWNITVEITGEELNSEGMLLDFTVIKEIVGKLDHRNLNDLFDINPTAENIARWIADEINLRICKDWSKEARRPFVSKVKVEESKGNTACYIPNFL